MAVMVQKKNNDYITSESQLGDVRNSLLKSFKNLNIQSLSVSKNSKTSTEPNDEKEMIEMKEFGKTKAEKGTMFDDIAEMEKTINIKGTRLEKQLLAFEKRLTNKNAKKHISRKCHGLNCNKMAPESYPNNIYLCDKHKAPLREKLEKYKIPMNRGTAEERKKCKKLDNSYQKVIESLKISDSQQSFGQNQHKFPKNYFSVSMSKLLLCQQQLSEPLPSATPNYKKIKKYSNKMQSVVKKLMDLLIVARQNLNCHWCCVCTMIVGVCTIIGGGIAWIVANSAYIVVLYGFLGFFIGVIIAGFIFGDRDMKFVSGTAAVGVGVGILAGGYAGAETGAAAGLVFGPIGAAVGGICGGLICGGLAAMYKYG